MRCLGVSVSGIVGEGIVLLPEGSLIVNVSILGIEGDSIGLILPETSPFVNASILGSDGKGIVLVFPEFSPFG